MVCTWEGRCGRRPVASCPDSVPPTPTLLRLGTRSELFNAKIYPTICKNELFVEGCDSANYTIIDMLGKNIHRGIMNNNTIEVAGLNAGIYLINFSLNETNVLKRFVKL